MRRSECFGEPRWSITTRMFMSCLHRSERIPVTSLHARSRCRCGRRGAHAIQPLMEVIAYHSRCAAAGEWPDVDFYGRGWPEDSIRKMMSDRGRPFFLDKNGAKCFAVICEVALDLDEVPKTLGLPDHRAGYGCFKCFLHISKYNDIGARGKNARTLG